MDPPSHILARSHDQQNKAIDKQPYGYQEVCSFFSAEFTDQVRAQKGNGQGTPTAKAKGPSCINFVIPMTLSNVMVDRKTQPALKKHAPTLGERSNRNGIQFICPKFA